MGTAARERIMNTAADLFYRQGYRATGINQVIAESGVAKASFYSHFPSKDDLLCECLRQITRMEIAELRQGAAAGQTAEDRFLAPMRSLIPWFEASEFRGCPFQNILGEAPPDDPRVREVARQHHENVRVLLRELSWDLLQERPDLKHLTPERLADTYLLLLEGSIPLAAAYSDPWPAQQAIETLKEMISSR